MKIRPGKDSFKADHFPSPSVPPTITQTTSQTQLRFHSSCETEARVSGTDTCFGLPMADHADPPLRRIMSPNQDATEARRLLLHVNEIDRRAMIVNEAFAQPGSARSNEGPITTECGRICKPGYSRRCSGTHHSAWPRTGTGRQSNAEMPNHPPAAPEPYARCLMCRATLRQKAPQWLQSRLCVILSNIT